MSSVFVWRGAAAILIENAVVEAAPLRHVNAILSIDAAGSHRKGMTTAPTLVSLP